MPSLRSRLFLFALKHRHLLRRPLDHTTPITEWRRRVEKGARLLGRLPDGVTVEPVSIGGLAAEWIRPADAEPGRILLYFHGGGYVMGDCPSHRAIVAKFATGSRTAALLFGYRLAPEHPFPAALEDALAAYGWLLAQGHAGDDVVFMGDSAGGGLSLATLLALRDRGGPMPARAVTLSPWTDLTCGGASYTANLGVEALAPRDCWLVFSAHYAGGVDAVHPLISPLHGRLEGLPPVLIHVGGNEVLLDDSRVFAQRAEAAGVDVTLRVGKGLFHCYPACAPLFPEAEAAWAECCDFICGATPRRR
ncbi:MAG: alpha/beta hydrolase [Magnetospirillum sp.]|nr:alpha/beta hydrolase [Magnetospirillum sp.]